MVAPIVAVGLRALAARLTAAGAAQGAKSGAQATLQKSSMNMDLLGNLGGLVGGGSGDAAGGAGATSAPASPNPIQPGLRQQMGNFGSGVFGDMKSYAGDKIKEMGEMKSPQGIAKFVADVVEAGQKVREWGKNLQETNLQFAEMSGSMAQLQAEVDVATFIRQREQGERRSDSARFLSGGSQRLENAVAPLEDLWAIVENFVVGVMLNGFSAILEKTGIPEAAKWLISLTGAGDGGDGNMQGWLENIAKEEEAARKRRPREMQQ